MKEVLFTEGMTTEKQLNVLENACRDVRHIKGEVIEIGCWEGKSTIRIANTLPTDKVLAVDTWKGNFNEDPNHETVVAAKKRDVYSRFRENIQAGTKGNVIPIKMDCHEFENMYKSERLKESGRFDDIKFLYIDACHDYKSVITTIRNLLPHMIKGGIMCGDDFLSAHMGRDDLDGGVERAVRESLPGMFAWEGNFWITRI